MMHSALDLGGQMSFVGCLCMEARVFFYWIHPHLGQVERAGGDEREMPWLSHTPGMAPNCSSSSHMRVEPVAATLMSSRGVPLGGGGTQPPKLRGHPAAPLCPRRPRPRPCHCSCPLTQLASRRPEGALRAEAGLRYVSVCGALGAGSRPRRPQGASEGTLRAPW